MAILNYAGHGSDFENAVCETVVSTTGGPRFSTYCARLYTVAQGTISFADKGEVWVAAYAQTHNRVEVTTFGTNYIGAGSRLLALSNGGTELVRLVFTSTTSMDLQLWDGAAWVPAVTGMTPRNFYAERLELHCRIDATNGYLELRSDGVVIGTFSGNTAPSGITTVNRCVAGTYHIGQPAYYTGWYTLFVADEEVRDITCVQTPTGLAGSVSEWQGPYGNVATTVGNVQDSSAIATETAGNLFTLAINELDTQFSSGYSILGIGAKARFRKTEGIAHNAALAVRHVTASAEANTVGSTRQLSTAYFPEFEMFTVNPITLAPWTPAEANSAEIGVMSVA